MCGIVGLLVADPDFNVNQLVLINAIHIKGRSGLHLEFFFSWFRATGSGLGRHASCALAGGFRGRTDTPRWPWSPHDALARAILLAARGCAREAGGLGIY